MIIDPRFENWALRSFTDDGEFHLRYLSMHWIQLTE
jgi:hypothetical protein